MIDIKSLKALAEAAPTGAWLAENDSLFFKDDGYTRHMLDADAGHDVEDAYYYAALTFIAAANPAAVLELIAEINALKRISIDATNEAHDAKHDLCELHKDYAKLDAQHESLCAQLALPSDVLADCEALRLDAERLNWLDTQSRPIAEGHCMGNPEGELIGYDWGVFGQCSTVREAIDAAIIKDSTHD